MIKIKTHGKTVQLFIFMLIILLYTMKAAGQDWTQWRGPQRDGVAPDFTVPQNWPASLALKWKVSLGTGYASPIVVGDHLFVLTRDEQKDEEVVSCLGLTDGKVLWQKTYPAPYTLNRAATRHGKGPKSTPIVHEGKLYALGISGILSCFDAASGNLKWRKDYSDQYTSTSPLYGTAMSPMVCQDLLIAHVGGHDQGALIACYLESGKEKWRWSGDGPGYASPIAAEFGGSKQIITQTQNHCVGICADKGALLWSIPFTTVYDQNIVTPVVYQDMIIFSGTKNGVMAVKPVERDQTWNAEKVWHNEKVSMYMNSPILSDNLLFGLADTRGGYFFCLDAKTGDMLWQSEGQKGRNAALLRAGHFLLALTNEAKLAVIKINEKDYNPIIQYEVADSPTWAHPVLLGKRIIVKDNTTVYLWNLEE